MGYLKYNELYFEPKFHAKAAFLTKFRVAYFLVCSVIVFTPIEIASPHRGCGYGLIIPGEIIPVTWGIEIIIFVTHGLFCCSMN